MSLLMNDEFAIYQLRSGYLDNFKDGIGERLITLNSAVLNNPAFRAAGWQPDTPDIRRTYSPPIPTAVTSEYFKAPPQHLESTTQDDEEDGTLLTGHGSHDTVGPTLQARRRRRKEQVEEDDSSELSDDSENDDDDKREAQRIKFHKMPVRIRSGSSPARPSKLKDEINEDDVKLMVTSPSKPAESGGIRRGSLSAIDNIKQRARRDTATSSEMSSENEDSAVFRRHKLPRRATTQSMLLPDIIQEEDSKLPDSDLEDEYISDASEMSDLDGPVEADILMNIGAPLAAVDTLDSSPPKIPGPLSVNRPDSEATKKRPSQDPPAKLAALPADKPITTPQTVSLLSKALKSDKKVEGNPIQRFAQLSGKGESDPLWIKVLFPGSELSGEHIEVPTRKIKDPAPILVADFIGLCLWRYGEESRKPAISGDDLNVNKWVLYMVDDGEVDYDFPPVTRTRPISDFTTKNNKPGRLRPGQKPWDEFAIVRATEKQEEENEKLTPDMSEAASGRKASVSHPARSHSETPSVTLRTNSETLALPHSFIPSRNPITGPSFSLHPSRKDSTAPLLDAPSVQFATSRSRSGASRTLKIHFTDPDTFQTKLLTISTTTDSYIAEVFSRACESLGLTNKALYVLKVRGTALVVPEDRTVEALGESSVLDLQRRRFIGVEHREGAASPSSESPNAPLLLTAATTPTKKGRRGLLSGAASRPAYDVGAIGFHQLGPGGKRYHVLRRQQLSFAPSHPKVLALDGEYVHIMPGGNMEIEGGGGGAGGGGGGGGHVSGKTTSVHLRDVIGVKVARKHPKLVRVLVYREKEEKRYDFEAESRAMAQEIVEEIRRGVERFGGED